MPGSNIWLPRPWYQFISDETAQEYWSWCLDIFNAILSVQGSLEDLEIEPLWESSQKGMGAYLVHYGLLEGPSLVAEQGHIMGRPGTVYIEVAKDGQAIHTVRVGGQAVTVMRGELFF